MDEVVTLVVSPFRDIVEKGKTAVDNAGGSQTMLRTAKSLVKEGERAIGYLELICRKRYEEYGSSFVDMLKENDEISRYHEDLTGLLWVFDDYTEAGGFDPGKYAQLQALSRKAAPKIYNILIRMKLEARPRYGAPLTMSQISPPSSPLLLHPQSPQSPLGSPFVMGRVASMAPPVPDCATDLSTVAGATMQLERITERGLLHSDDDDDNDPVRPESPVDPHFLRASPGYQRRPGSSIVRKSSASGLSQPQALSDSSKPVNSILGQTGRGMETKPVTRISEGALTEEPVVPLPLPQAPRYLTRPSSPRRVASDMLPRSPTDIDMVFKDDHETLQQSGVARTNPGPPLLPTPGSAAKAESALGGQSPILGCPVRVEPLIPVMEIDAGLIPIEQERLDMKSDARLWPSKGATIGASSSFYQYKGFCEGAQQVTRGELGIKKVQKPVQRTLSRIVAKCTGCPYELDFNQIESDLSKQARSTTVAKLGSCRAKARLIGSYQQTDDGNFCKSGISYRLRFLQKSHLAAKKADDVSYGCVFCVHQGHTLEDDDATVFFTTEALFSHLARHPRPLPKVPGICVVEESAMPSTLRNNYDVYFPTPPEMHPATAKRGEIAERPSGVALKESRQLYGQKRPSDRSAALDLAVGARITGIEWPAKYKGGWMFAWHDAGTGGSEGRCQGWQKGHEECKDEKVRKMKGG